jgi:C4-dicarboxylate transporter DctM subunit
MTSSVIIILMAMATLFGNIMTIEQVPERITSIILSMTENKIIILLLINLFLLWIGTFMEALAAIVIITPILMPLILKIGMDPIHFGVVMVVNLAIGFFTPPVGVNLFVASGMSGTKLTAVARAGMPLLIAMLVVLLLVTYIPFLSLALL